MEINKIYCEDCLRTLFRIPNNSINCVVTSPPYYGLRDYGTAEWVGGDKNCNHNPQRPDGGERNNRTLPLGRGGMYKEVCLKCGALRVDNQLGQENTPEKYIERLVMIFGEIKRVLRLDGTVWLNLGDSYFGSGGASGQSPEALNLGKTKAERGYASEGITRNLKFDYLKPKDLIGIPWRVAFALQKDGWYLRQDIIWYKKNPMPESVKDRCTKAHEYIFLLTKSKKYFYDYQAIQEPMKDVSIARAFRGLSEENKWNEGAPGSTAHAMSKPREKVPISERKKFTPEMAGGGSGVKGHSGYKNAAGRIIGNGMANKRSVWTVSTMAFKDAHFAVFPEDLIKPCILAGCPVGGMVYDPFIGSGTTGMVALDYDRKFIGSELNSDSVKIADKRLKPLLTQTRLEL